MARKLPVQRPEIDKLQPDSTLSKLYRDLKENSEKAVNATDGDNRPIDEEALLEWTQLGHMDDYRDVMMSNSAYLMAVAIWNAIQDELEGGRYFSGYYFNGSFYRVYDPAPETGGYQYLNPYSPREGKLYVDVRGGIYIWNKEQNTYIPLSGGQSSGGSSGSGGTVAQTIYDLVIKKNGVQVGQTYNPAKKAQIIDIKDVASAESLIQLIADLSNVGRHDLPVYLTSNGRAIAIDALKVPGDIESTDGDIKSAGDVKAERNVEAGGGVSAKGVADLTQSQTGGGGGGGDVHGVRIGNGTAIGPDEEGIVPLPAYPVTPSQSQMNAWDAKYDKPIGGIPKSDLSNGVASSLDKADSSVQPEALEPIVNSIGMAVSMARDNKEAIDELDDALSDHKNDKNNPHEVTKSQVGLGNVDNTSDLSKPVSTATQTELNKKVDKASLVSKGSAVHPIYFDNSGEAQEVTGIDVPNNVQAGGGVSAQGIADLSQAAGGGRGLVNGVRIGEGAPIGPDAEGIVPLPAYPTWNDLKPQGGITKNDLSLNVQSSLEKADSAVQPEDLPEVPDVVTFDNLNPSEAETTQKVATAKSVAILKDRIGVEELDEYDPTIDYHRGDIVKVTSGGIATGYRFKLETPVGTAMAGRVEKLTYKTLANPLNIVGIENILV